MNWTFRIGPHDFDTIAALPAEAQSALDGVIDVLELDPYLATGPFGEDDGVTRITSFGTWGTLILLVNPRTQRITPLSTVWAG
ncbi:hypothetical protein ABT160_26005 [Streptomyces sp. NPDC001941]|uniref:hypothetical protein n=1 Tax=Streptomyces sp. NPDC001941 TaxID=3154659 RepID=UPI00331AE35D